jgi:hypothetical protein
MSVKLLWKAKLQHWKNEIRRKKMLSSLTRLRGKKSSTSPSASPSASPGVSRFASPQLSPVTSPASSPRRMSVVRLKPVVVQLHDTCGCVCGGSIALFLRMCLCHCSFRHRHRHASRSDSSACADGMDLWHLSLEYTSLAHSNVVRLWGEKRGGAGWPMMQGCAITKLPFTIALDVSICELKEEALMPGCIL